MKRTAAFIFLLLVLAMSFGKWLVLMEFEMNRSFIAAQLCVSRTRPENGCKGKCQLNKALRTEESPAQAPAGTYKIKLPETVAAPAETTLPAVSCLGHKTPYPPLTLPAYPSPLRAIFHPPA